MSDQIRVVLSCAMSIDGAIDDTSEDRLLLSDTADFDRVDELRAGCDAILVGGETIRSDDPRLLVRSESRRARRRAAGVSENPLKVAISRDANLDPGAQFFTAGPAQKIVYCTQVAAQAAHSRLGHEATVVGISGDHETVDRHSDIDLGPIIADLEQRGVRRLLVEGGSRIHTAFLTAGLADELLLVVAPFFVGEADAPRFVTAGRFPHDTGNRMRLTDVQRLGDLALLHYLLDSGTDG